MTRFLTLLAAALCFTCAAAHAATCSLSQSAIAIAGYDVFPATDKIVPVASGTLVLHCSNLNAGTTTVTVGELDRALRRATAVSARETAPARTAIS